MCLVPAGLLAACSLNDDDGSDGTSSPVAATAPDAATTSQVATTAPSTESSPTSTEAPPSSAVAADEAPISFASDIEPIIERTCASCHTGSGPGTQHVVMDTANDVAFASVGLELATRTGFMPPWPAGEESVDFQHDWSLSPEEVDLIGAWHHADSPLDVPDDHPIEPSNITVGLTDPDVVVPARGSYDGTLDQPDEYRCFVFDPGLDERRFVQAMEFVPDQSQVVHHAIGSVIKAEDVPRLDDLEGSAADGQGGWTCFGFNPTPSSRILLGWAPGQAPTRYEDGSGLELEPGDVFVIQIHYHFDVEAPADNSQLAIEWAEGSDVDPIDVGIYVAPAEIPCASDETGPLCDRETAKRAAVAKYGGEGVLADPIMRGCGYAPEDFAGMTAGVASASCDQPVQTFGKLLSVLGHEHELGKTFRMTLNPDTPDEIVLLDIPRWDFNWQLQYQPVDAIELEPGDWVRIECSWDRSLRDAELEPAYVLWADGTDDEMCFATMTTRPT